MTNYHKQLLDDEELHYLQAQAAHKLSSKERMAIDAMCQENLLSVLEDLFRCLKEGVPTSLIQPAPADYSDLNKTIQDIIRDFRGE